MSDADRFVVEVRENVTEALIEHKGRVYVSPPQDREQALELVAVLLGHPTSLNGGAEQLWRQAIAGGEERQAAAGDVEEAPRVNAPSSSTTGGSRQGERSVSWGNRTMLAGRTVKTIALPVSHAPVPGASV